MEAEISGHQRKVLRLEVRPLKRAHGNLGIPLRDGRTLPFAVTRAWNAPAGHYLEQWYLVHPQTREVLYEGPATDRLIWGLLAWTDVADEVREPIPLDPGTYLVVCALGGVVGGEFEVEAAEVSAEAAA